MTKRRMNRGWRIAIALFVVYAVAVVPVLVYQYLDPSAGRYILALLIGGVGSYVGVTLGWLWDTQVKEHDRMRGE